MTDRKTPREESIRVEVTRRRTHKAIDTVFVIVGGRKD